MNSKNNILRGADYIRNFARNLSSDAGVYRMINESGEVIYVGKAKHLKNRVSSYASKGALPTRTLKMIADTARMEIVTTKSEAEALLLEASLIKRFNPKYNILLKDDKSYPFIEFTAHQAPQIRKYRGAKRKHNIYYGPFASVGALNEVLEILQKAFLLRPCSDSVFANRSRPCLQYQIKLCSAPCVGKIGEDEYIKLVEQAKEFLSGKTNQIQADIARQMEEYSANMDYEKAASCRDRIAALTQIQQEQAISNAGLDNADAIAIHHQSGKYAIQAFFFRGGQHYGTKVFYPKARADDSLADVMSAFLSQFYEGHIAPKSILLNIKPSDMALIEEALTLKNEYKITISVPTKGKKKKRKGK